MSNNHAMPERGNTNAGGSVLPGGQRERRRYPLQDGGGGFCSCLTPRAISDSRPVIRDTRHVTPDTCGELPRLDARLSNGPCSPSRLAYLVRCLPIAKYVHGLPEDSSREARFFVTRGSAHFRMEAP
jgi:hypothetical protein